MIPMEQFRYIPLQQLEAAPAKDFTVHLGWQPDLIEVIKIKNGGLVAVFAKGISAAGKFTLLPTDAAAMDGEADNGITLLPKGFRFGQNGFFKENDAKLAFKCYRNLESTKLILLKDAGATTKDFGDGKQFGVRGTFSLDKGQPASYGGLEVTKDA